MDQKKVKKKRKRKWRTIIMSHCDECYKRRRNKYKKQCDRCKRIEEAVKYVIAERKAGRLKLGKPAKYIRIVAG